MLLPTMMIHGDDVIPSPGDPPSGSEDSSLEGGEREPLLRVPEELTPLPEIERSLPILSLFGGIVGRRRAPYKIGLLKTLQGDGSGRWKIRRLQEIVHWLEPGSVTDLVGELRSAGVLTYDPVSAYYRLTPDARVVVAILNALTVPDIEPRRLIKFLNKAMSLALAAGAGEDAVFSQFASAVAVLRGDREELRSLIDDFSEAALLEAAELVRAHVDDMRELLDEHEAFFAEHRGEALFLEREQDSLDLVAKLGHLAAEVIQALSGRATERMRGGLRIDRGDLRKFLAEHSLEELASLVEGLAITAPSVGWVPVEAAFASLLEAAGRVRPEPPPLPEPNELVREAPSALVDPLAELVAELAELREPAALAEVVIRETWEIAVARSGAVVAAYASDAASLPTIDDSGEMAEPSRGGVWRISQSILRPREIASASKEEVASA